MPVNYATPAADQLLPVAGIRLGTAEAEIRKNFRHHPDVKIEAIICNKAKAGVLDVAQEFQVPYYLITKKDLYETDHVLNLLKHPETDLIVLAGFLWLIPENILQAFPGKIINIHPALLPSHGGAGMYGKKVHESVILQRIRKPVLPSITLMKSMMVVK